MVGDHHIGCRREPPPSANVHRFELVLFDVKVRGHRLAQVVPYPRVEEAPRLVVGPEDPQLLPLADLGDVDGREIRLAAAISALCAVSENLQPIEYYFWWRAALSCAGMHQAWPLRLGGMGGVRGSREDDVGEGRG